MQAIKPVSLVLINGEERQFLLSMGGIRRLKARFKVEKLSEILNQDAEASGVPILFEALIDKNGMTEEQFADQLPSHLTEIVKVVGRLLGASLPDPKAEDPTPPTPVTTAIQ